MTPKAIPPAEACFVICVEANQLAVQAQLLCESIRRFAGRYAASRIVAICVSDPIGNPAPRFTASTPAMNVVLTAPIPGIKIPNLPSAGAMRTLSEVGKSCSSPYRFLSGRTGRSLH